MLDRWYFWAIVGLALADILYETQMRLRLKMQKFKKRRRIMNRKWRRSKKEMVLDDS